MKAGTENRKMIIDFFIFITTGSKIKETFALPFCLLDAQTRLFLKMLLETTRDSKGRLNSKPAILRIVAATKKSFLIPVNLEFLSTMLVSLECLPESILRSEKSSKHCSLCSHFSTNRPGEPSV